MMSRKVTGAQHSKTQLVVTRLQKKMFRAVSRFSWCGTFFGSPFLFSPHVYCVQRVHNGTLPITVFYSIFCQRNNFSFPYTFVPVMVYFKCFNVSTAFSCHRYSRIFSSQMISERWIDKSIYLFHHFDEVIFFLLLLWVFDIRYQLPSIGISFCL